MKTKFKLVEALKSYGFTDSQLLDMFIYWSDIGTVEECVKDYLNDKDLQLDQNQEVEVI